MNSPRRRIVRPAVSPKSRRLEKLRTRLDREYQALSRWQRRLNRAFKAFTKHQRAIAQLQHQLGQLEDRHASHD